MRRWVAAINKAAGLPQKETIVLEWARKFLNASSSQSYRTLLREFDSAGVYVRPHVTAWR
jgi:hypothetical protein